LLLNVNDSNIRQVRKIGFFVDIVLFCLYDVAFYSFTVIINFLQERSKGDNESGNRQNFITSHWWFDY